MLYFKGLKGFNNFLINRYNERNCKKQGSAVYLNHSVCNISVLKCQVKLIHTLMDMDNLSQFTADNILITIVVKHFMWKLNIVLNEDKPYIMNINKQILWKNHLRITIFVWLHLKLIYLLAVIIATYNS